MNFKPNFNGLDDDCDCGCKMYCVSCSKYELGTCFCKNCTSKFSIKTTMTNKSAIIQNNQIVMNDSLTIAC